jgi:hypothetical protein
MRLRLEPLPETFATTRDALHRVAERIVAPARKPHNEIALVQTPGGFGTPPFEFEGRDLQVMVDGAELVVVSGGDERRTALTTLADAARFVGADLFFDGIPADASPLGVDPVAARRLGDLYAVAAEALSRFAASLPPDAAPSSANLWPEHFDIAIEAGDQAAAQRANYGVSPGDDDHQQPYAYVGPWSQEVGDDPGWNASGFVGAELPYAALADAEDPVEAIVALFESRRRALTRL